MTSTEPPARGFRPEVQGLRALAVGLVVLYHFWPTRLPGGFVGVDVFFVISGFLITAHLVREAERDGTVSLRRFWARRIRRLLPASLLVLVVCAVATYLWVFPTQWATTARALIASALYVQNWALAADAVNYLAQGDAPTVAQHFWSLSVEEQFYVVWPLLLVGGLALARRLRCVPPVRRTAAVVIAVVGVGSFVVSVLATASDPAWAYFATPTRLWELALGAGLALVRVRLHVGLRVLLGWAGVAAVAASALLLDAATPFPGWVSAIPTLGTAAVIAAGRTGARVGVDRLLSLRPATFFGDISYSVYLWHWPVVVLAPTVLARQPDSAEKVAAIAVVVLLSWLTKVGVEDRWRRARTDRRGGVARTYAAAAAGMAVVVVLGWGIRWEMQTRADEAAAAAADLPADCVGPGALTDPDRCGGVMGTGPLVAPPEAVVLQNDEPAYPGCQQTGSGRDPISCALGADDPAAPVVLLVGDSHATQWFPTFDRLGREQGVRVETLTKSSCPPTLADRVVESEQSTDLAESCRDWLAQVSRIVSERQPALVVVTAYSSAYAYVAPDDVVDPAVADDPAVGGYAALWRQWVEQGIDVTAIAAIPRTQGEVVPDCLAGHRRDFAACATARSDALPADPLVAAAAQAQVPLVDLSDRFCDDRTCYPVVGNVIVYRDYSHLSQEYALALTRYVEDALPALAAE